MSYIYDLTDTWNAGGTTFNGIKLNVTDSASAVTSKLVSLQTNGTEHFSVTKAGVGYFSGNLGIGTSSPATRLDVVGGVQSAGFYRNVNVVSVGDAANYVGIGSLNGTTPTPGAAIGAILNNPATTGSMLFYTRSADALSERMRIDSSGNVGIGTSSPSSKLTVAASNVTVNAGYGIAFTGDQTRIMTPEDNVYGALINWGASGGCRFFQGTTERMRIDGLGNVGIGTSSPTGKLSLSLGNATGGGGIGPILAWDSTYAVFGNIGASSPAVGLGYSSTYGGILTAIAPLVAWQPMNYLADRHVFHTNALERMRIDASGNLLVGVSSPFSGYGAKQTIYWNAAAEQGITLRSSTDTYSGNPIIFVNASNTTSGFISQSSTTVTYNTSSDVRLKHDIVDAPEASNLIDAIQVRSFKWNADNSEQRYGFVAQELVTVAPEAVSQPADPDDMMGVDYSKLVPMLVKEIQSMRLRLAQLEGNQNAYH